MSTKFYIKDENGNILSMDGKTRYTLLEGKAAYDFLKTEDGKRRCFHVEIDENGDKLGIEANPEIEKQYEADLIARGIPKEKIRKYGFAFEGKKVLIGTV